MALDSKDSDLEQLRCQISSLSVHSLDSTSISSGNDLEMGDGYPGRPSSLTHDPLSWQQQAQPTFTFKVLKARKQTHFCMHFLISLSLTPSSCSFLCFHCESLYFLGQLFLTFSLLLFFLFPSRFTSSSSSSPRGPVQCALLTPTLQNQCPSPTSAHTNLSASTPDPTSVRLVLSLTPRMKRNTTGEWSRVPVPWPSPMNSPLRLNLQVILHGSLIL